MKLTLAHLVLHTTTVLSLPSVGLLAIKVATPFQTSCLKVADEVEGVGGLSSAALQQEAA